ncbi:MAG: hypothetical protein KAX78_06725 [Phycisphaerae bacterium]|nr:hypothetical protein [Phycisphaerae bacterium]
MTHLLTIAAKGFDLDDVIQFVVILGFVLISIIGGIMQKRLANKEQEQRARGQDEAKGHRGVQAAKRPPWLVREEVEPPPEPQPAQPVRIAAPPPIPRADDAIRSSPQLQPHRARDPVQPRPQIRRPTKKTTLGSLQTAALQTKQPAPPRQLGPRPAMVDLGGADEARRAIIYHEILSPPKALREGGEMWEL